MDSILRCYLCSGGGESTGSVDRNKTAGKKEKNNK